MTIQQAARYALDVQNGCNASGVVFSLSKAMEAICEESNRRGGEGTDWKNKHPILYLYVNKLADMTGQNPFDITEYGRAYRLCEKIAEGQTDVY